MSKGVNIPSKAASRSDFVYNDISGRAGSFFREVIKKGKNVSLASTWVDQTRPILYLRRIPYPRQRKPRLARCVDEVRHARWLHKLFEESFFKVLVGGREGFKQNTACPVDQRMPANRVGHMRGVEVQEASGGRTHTERLANHAKSLHGRPRIRVQLTRRHVECLPWTCWKETTCASQKKRQLYMKKKGGSMDDCSLYTRSSSEQGLNDSRESLAKAFRTRTLFKKSATKTLIWKTDVIPKTLGSTQSGPSWGRGHSDELNRSDALPASSPLTSSISGQWFELRRPKEFC